MGYRIRKLYDILKAAWHIDDKRRQKVGGCSADPTAGKLQLATAAIAGAGGESWLGGSGGPLVIFVLK